MLPAMGFQMYYLDGATPKEQRSRLGANYRIVIRHAANPTRWVLRFELLDKDAYSALQALNAPDTLERVRRERDQEEAA